MCLSKYSNLELLKEVARNLYSSKDHENMNRLCEKQLAELINTFYQVWYFCLFLWKKCHLTLIYVGFYNLHYFDNQSKNCTF